VELFGSLLSYSYPSYLLRTKTCFDFNYLVAPSLYYEGGEAREQVAQRSCGCPLPGSVQGQVGWGFEQPGLVEGLTAHVRVVGSR